MPTVKDVYLGFWDINLTLPLLEDPTANLKNMLGAELTRVYKNCLNDKISAYGSVNEVVRYKKNLAVAMEGYLNSGPEYTQYEHRTNDLDAFYLQANNYWKQIIGHKKFNDVDIKKIDSLFDGILTAKDKFVKVLFELDKNSERGVCDLKF